VEGGKEEEDDSKGICVSYQDVLCVLLLDLELYQGWEMKWAKMQFTVANYGL